MNPKVIYGLELIRLAIKHNRLPHSSDRLGTGDEWVKHSPVLEEDDNGPSPILLVRKDDGAVYVDFEANPFPPGDDCYAFNWPRSAHERLHVESKIQEILND